MSRKRAPQGAEEIRDDLDRQWRYVRGPLDIRAAKRLVLTAHAVITGHLPGWGLARVETEDRRGYWESVKAGLESRNAAVHYVAYEYVADGGEKLLFLDTFC
ncbi:hypothetical protein [Kitasatospora cinereorecta]|uniref:Uncharacterized protein n=1 Tax=Kitasatospora cinereorecta TaxID=285560 RepID=A0ABW0VBX6_9ACTN